jgi:hypothetical protein
LKITFAATASKTVPRRRGKLTAKSMVLAHIRLHQSVENKKAASPPNWPVAHHSSRQKGLSLRQTQFYHRWPLPTPKLEQQRERQA